MKLWLATIAALWCSMMVSAHDLEVDGLYYNISSETDLTVEVTYEGEGYTFGFNFHYNGAIIIPSTVTYNGKAYNVTSIGGGAFYGGSNITSITIPKSVTNIGGYAFRECNGLTSIDIPESVTSIAEGAFYRCYNLTSITIPESVKIIGENAFDECSSLEAVYINNIAAWCDIDFENSVANPLRYAKNLYLNGKLVTELTIPNTVTAIKDYAFYDCI